MNNAKCYDIVIIGNTISAFSLASQLSNDQSLKVLWLRTNNPNYLSWDFCEAYSGLDTSFARISHARGKVVAENIQQFTDRSLEYTKDFLASLNVDTKDSVHIRRAKDKLESQELIECVNIAPSSSNYLVDRTKKFAELNSDSFQVELSKLNTHTVFLNSIFEEIVHLSKENGNFEIRCEKNTYSCIIPVLLCDSTSKSLDSILNSSLISATDQCARYDKRSDIIYSISEKHSYLWAVQSADYITLGGGRFMRKMAGFEDENPAFSDEIQRFLKSNFDLDQKNPELKQLVYVDHIPCDEMPLLGPLSGVLDGALIFAGKMTRSIAMDFYAAAILRDYIYNGHSKRNVLEFLPARLYY